MYFELGDIKSENKKVAWIRTRYCKLGGDELENKKKQFQNFQIARMHLRVHLENVDKK